MFIEYGFPGPGTYNNDKRQLVVRSRVKDHRGTSFGKSARNYLKQTMDVARANPGPG